MNHTKEQRIRVHVGICVLAYLLSTHAENTCLMSWKKIRSSLGGLHAGCISSPQGTFVKTTESNKEQRSILHILDKTSVASERSQTQTIPEIPPVARSIKVPTTCSRGYRSVDSNLTSGTINGAGQYHLSAEILSLFTELQSRWPGSFFTLHLCTWHTLYLVKITTSHSIYQCTYVFINVGFCLEFVYFSLRITAN